jgi:hypothetical protein
MNSPESTPSFIKTLFNSNGDSPYFVWVAAAIEIAFAAFLIVNGYRIWRNRRRARELGEHPTEVGSEHKSSVAR